MKRGDHVYAVHATRQDDVGAVEVVFTNEREARRFATDRSHDYAVLAAAVTRFTIGELGTRHAVAWFVEGQEQPARKARPGRLYPVADAETGEGA